MNAILILLGIGGIVLSFLLAKWLFPKLGPAFNAVSTDFAQQRMDEMRDSLFTLSGSSIGKGIVMSFLAGILMLPLAGCLLSFMLIVLGFSIR